MSEELDRELTGEEAVELILELEEFIESIKNGDIKKVNTSNFKGGDYSHRNISSERKL